MPKICYRPKRFHSFSKTLIAKANEMLEDYVAQGYTLTLRQLYYQFVARNLLPNVPESYDQLGNVINDARLAGLIDWNHIEDRSRQRRALPHWESPGDIISACAGQYTMDRWHGQYHYVEVWVEKDALLGITERVCNALDVSYFSCRGYVSQSEMWRAAKRLGAMNYADVHPVVLHFGDHDPSGLHMTTDIAQRFVMFGADVTVRRIALTKAQVRHHRLPPNPAKTTDSRYAWYSSIHGEESWELDALEPRVLDRLMRDAIEGYIVHESAWKAQERREKGGRGQLRQLSGQWDGVTQWLKKQRRDRRR